MIITHVSLNVNTYFHFFSKRDAEAKKIKLELDHLKSITFTKKYRFDDKDYYFKTIIKVLKKEG